MAGPSAGETYTERSKGKDVRTSNIVAAKVSGFRTGGGGAFSGPHMVRLRMQDGC
jgi:hypothetical protein